MSFSGKETEKSALRFGLFGSLWLYVIERLVTGDETMILCYDLQSKRDTIEYRYKGETSP